MSSPFQGESGLFNSGYSAGFCHSLVNTKTVVKPLLLVCEAKIRQSAQRLRPRQTRFRLRFDPAIKRSQLGGVEPYHHRRPLTGRFWTSFLWYQSFLICHRNLDIKKASRTEATNDHSALTTTDP
jgi:hypothetical protein